MNTITRKYFYERNGLWRERIQEFDALGGKQASSIARLIKACETGDISQFASEDLKMVSSQIAAMSEEIEILKQTAAEAKR